MASKDETNQWIHFFEDAGLPSNVAVKYALTFSENRIKKAMLLDLNKEYLKEMGITLMGDIISILKHAKDVSEEDARTKVLKNHEVYGPALPPKPVVKKTSVTVPASRILDHFTPKVASKAVVQTAVAKKRPLPVASKSYDEYSEESEPEVLPKPVMPKKAPQIRSAAVAKRVITKTVAKPKAPIRQKIQPAEVEVIEPPTKKVRRVLPEHEGKYNITMPAGTTPRTQKILSEKVVVSSTVGKKTVFDRLGDSSVSSTTGGMVSPVREVEPRITITGLGNPIRPTTQLASEKFNSSVFARLGNKPMAAVAASATYREEVVEQPKLKYAGVLKKPATATATTVGPIKKKIIKTIVKKRIPVSGTMRSDLTELGVQHRLGVSSTTTVAKVLPIKKNIISLKKPQLPMRSSVATLKPDQGVTRYGVKNRISSMVTNSSYSTTKKVVTSRIQDVSSTSTRFGKDSGNVFARLGR